MIHLTTYSNRKKRFSLVKFKKIPPLIHTVALLQTVMTGVWCEGKSMALSVPVARYLSPSGAGKCVSVTSTAGVTDIAAQCLYYMCIYTKLRTEKSYQKYD